MAQAFSPAHRALGARWLVLTVSSDSETPFEIECRPCKRTLAVSATRMLSLGSLSYLAGAALISNALPALHRLLTSGIAKAGSAAAAVAVGRGLNSNAASSSLQHQQPDVLIVGAGHNGLVAATLLARQGLAVEVYEEKDIVGGACRTEYPFAKAPGLPQSTGAPCFLCTACLPAWPALQTALELLQWWAVRLSREQDSSFLNRFSARSPAAGAYLLGVMPPELLQLLELDLPLRRRDPVSFSTFRSPSARAGSGRASCMGTAGHAALAPTSPPQQAWPTRVSLLTPPPSPPQHYFLPTADGSGRYLLFGSDAEATKEQFLRFFSRVRWGGEVGGRRGPAGWWAAACLGRKSSRHRGPGLCEAHPCMPGAQQAA